MLPPGAHPGTLSTAGMFRGMKVNSTVQLGTVVVLATVQPELEKMRESECIRLFHNQFFHQVSTHLPLQVPHLNSKLNSHSTSGCMLIHDADERTNYMSLYCIAQTEI